MIIKVFLATFLGVILSGIWFGTNVLLQISKVKVLIKMRVVLASILPILLVMRYSDLGMWKVTSVIQWECWLLIIVTVGVTSLIVSKNKVERLLTGKELWEYAFNGVLMEIPQRMMMQSFIYGLMKYWELNVCLSVPITAIVWCISICIQCHLLKQDLDKSVWYDCLASFLFSMGVGVVLIHSQFIGFTMIAHFAERVVSSKIRANKDRENDVFD